jgi:hypothetical protein
MIVGVPRETKSHEYRVSLLPVGVRDGLSLNPSPASGEGASLRAGGGKGRIARREGLAQPLPEGRG